MKKAMTNDQDPMTKTEGSREGAKAQSADAMAYTINVRPYGQTYIATVSGEAFQASCTMSEIAAAQTCAEKFCKKRGLKLESLLRYGTANVWILSASAPLREVPS